MRIVRFGTKEGDVVEGFIPPTLQAMQAIVEGYIEVVHMVGLEEHGVLMVVNEEGLLAHLDPNENCFPWFFVGNVFFVAQGDEDFQSLNDEQVARIYELFEVRPQDPRPLA